MKIGTDIHAAQRITPNDFGDTVTFLCQQQVKVFTYHKYFNTYKMDWYKIWNKHLNNHFVYLLTFFTSNCEMLQQLLDGLP